MAACSHLGCNGVVEEGYCTTCGLAPLGASARLAAETHAGGGGLGTTRSGPSTRAAARRSLGALPSLRPALPPLDPQATVVPGVVPDRKRLCSACGAKLGRESGFCPTCGQEYAFKPSLSAGDVIAGKYQIKGTLAFGGLGWIYLALDTVLGRWVVLKGLLNAKDPGMVALAVKEREFLAAVKHRSIVNIYDFVAHGREGFIVMEYVNGKTLMSLRQERGGPLPVAEAISYVLELLPAFAHLGEMGLVYCDMKPENAMVEGEGVKLIDLGSVRRVADPEGDVYGSRGYAAPESSERPTPLSDLFSVGRALAVLVADFDFQGAHEYTLPRAVEVPAFAQHDSLYRFLARATAAKPGERFQSAQEMGEQLFGVLREASAGVSDLGPVESARFERADRAEENDDPSSIGSSPLRGVPALKVDGADPGAGVILAAASLPDLARRLSALERALALEPASVELQLRTADALADARRFSEAEEALARQEQTSAGDWRLDWYRARLRLVQGRTQEAVALFERVVDHLPGELAPKQALGRARELLGDWTGAIRSYELVSRAEPELVDAAFGLARCLHQQSRLAEAANAFGRVPASSSRYGRAQLALARVLLDGKPQLPELSQAGEAIERVRGLDGSSEIHQVAALLLRVAAEQLERKAIAPDAATRLLGTPLKARELRRQAEGELRACARVARSEGEKLRLIDEANRVRPFTLV